ncbi:MAG: glycosyltransferase [Candidatus Shapirobacteria bacterium]|jgi:UDP-N-acetylglucosamine--N-acetylmuramyl-(pentapeptide) pyrophosphoryl-undecaprenol N-acetylglucosamine transferase
MPNNKVICLTGNHHTPAIELIRQLKQQPQKWQISYLTHSYQTETHIKNTIIPKLNVSLHLIQCNKFDRQKPLLSIFKTPLLIVGIFQSLLLLKSEKPDIVVSFGGYVSVPVIIAAWILKIPSITHEQTLTIGLATKINSYFCQKVALSFPGPDINNKTIVTGNLLRQQIFDTKSKKYQSLESKIKKSPLIYITGGSQGSQFINDLTVSILPQLSQYTIIHQTGPKPTQTNNKYPNYHQTEYIDLEDIGWVFHQSSLIVSRAGANICQEIATLNHQSIIIPHPKTQQDEQIKNAQWLKSRLPELTTIIPQSKANSSLVTRAIFKHLNSKIKNNKTIAGQTTHPLINLINEMV